MTDRALDDLARRVLLDVIDMEYGDAIEELPEHDFSPAFEKKMKKLIRRADHPIRYRIIRATACVLLAALLSGCAVLAFVPEARATFTRWVTEWYETHLVYRYAGGSLPEDLPQYEITELPEGFVESKRTESSGMANITYKNESGDVISLKYIFMAQGGASFFGTENSDIFDIKVHHMSGQFFESKIPGNFNRITWIDEDQNIQFGISGAYSYADILGMAESVSFAKKDENPELGKIEFDYLPAGMSEIGRDYIPQTHYQAIWFEDSMGRRFEISQDIMTSNKQSTLILDTEDAEATKIDFNGYDATLITKGEQTMLLCVDDDSCVLLSGDFPPEEIIKIANGVNILKK